MPYVDSPLAPLGRGWRTVVLIDTLPKRSPDFSRLRRVLLRQSGPDRVPFVELFAYREIMESFLGERFPDPKVKDRDVQQEYVLELIEFGHRAGYDCVSIGPDVELPIRSLQADDTANILLGQASAEK